MPRTLVGKTSWWWVFALFIAVPALALTALGVRALRADEIEARQRFREQQAQIARLADAALSTAFDRESAYGYSHGSSSSADRVSFEVDESGTLWFPGDRLYIARSGAEPPAQASVGLSPESRTLVEAAQSADAQGRGSDAAKLFARLRSVPAIRTWADLQLSLSRPDGLQPLLRAAPFGVANSDARSPAGIPVAIVAASLSEDAPSSDRRAFVPLLHATLRSLREGRWWLSLDQRRLYDAELRRWLSAIEPTSEMQADDRIQAIGEVARNIGETLSKRRQPLPRAQLARVSSGHRLLIWDPAPESDQKKRGVALTNESTVGLFTATLSPLVSNSTFDVSLRVRDVAAWGTTDDRAAAHRIDLDSFPGWALEFGDSERSRQASGKTALDYAAVLFPIVVLGCGLVMTAWIVRRELALAQLQATFIAAVTHEFKSPITSIRLLMERIAGGRIPPGDTPERYYTAVDVEAQRLETLVNRLLEAQKLQTGQKQYLRESTRIEAVAADVVERLRPQAEAHKIALAFHAEPALPALAIDVESVSDAVRNLIDNAIKYSPPGGRVDVAIGESDGHVQITVRDEGLGVDPREAQRIFEPFYRSKRGDAANVHGTGLGLSLVKATVHAHGGTVTVDSDGVRGSRFALSFPINSGAGALTKGEGLTWRES